MKGVRKQLEQAKIWLAAVEANPVKDEKQQRRRVQKAAERVRRKYERTLKN